MNKERKEVAPMKLRKKEKKKEVENMKGLQRNEKNLPE